MQEQRGRATPPASLRESLFLLDVAVGASMGAAATARTVARGVGSVAGPFAEVVLRPPLVGPRLQPATWLNRLAVRGSRRRDELLREAAALLDALVPAVTAELVRRLDLVELIAQYVDIDQILLQVDMNTAAGRLDVDAVAQRLDIEAVIDRLDLNEIVRQRVDLDGLVAGVDLDAIAARLDIDAVIERVDLVGLAQDVIAEIDLPEIIRESTGSVASESLRGVRMQSISGDDAIGRAVDRLRLRRSRRSVAATTPVPVPSPDDPGAVPPTDPDSAARTT